LPNPYKPEQKNGSTVQAFVKSPKIPLFVILAKAGIQSFQVVADLWTPVFTGVTSFYETVRVQG
jgi:hypothetical protein